MSVTPTGKSRFAPVQIIDSRQAIELVSERIVAVKLNFKAHAALAARIAGKNVTPANSNQVLKGWNTSLFTTYVPWVWALGERLYVLDDGEPVFLSCMADAKAFAKKAQQQRGGFIVQLPEQFKARGLGSGTTTKQLISTQLHKDMRLKTIIDLAAFFEKPLMFGQPR